MARVEISEELKVDIFRKFKSDAVKIFELLYSLRENPNKGKKLGSIGGVLIKEIKYKSFRFYFIVSGHRLRIMSTSEFENLFIRFVRMSNKKDQQKVIDEIKEVLKKLGQDSF